MHHDGHGSRSEFLISHVVPAVSFDFATRKVRITRLSAMNSSAESFSRSPERSTSLVHRAINNCLPCTTSRPPSAFDLDTDSRLAPMSSLCIVSVGHPESAFILTDIPANGPASGIEMDDGPLPRAGKGCRGSKYVPDGIAGA